MKILPLCQLWASLLFLLHSCSNPHVDRVLSSAEQLMDSGFPDSAWIYLNSLRPEEIREARLRARLSLDRAMALDKSYVDTSDIAILAPVISFYKWPFHQKKRYLTAYYQGRILENGKKDEEAIKALTRAGNLAGRSGDSLYMVRICSAKARIYLRNYALRQAEEATDEGLRWCAPHSPNWSVLMLDKTEHLLARKQYEQVDHVLISLPPSSPRWFEAAVHLCRACPEYRKDYEDIFRHNGSLLKSIHPRVQAEYFLMEGEPSRALEMLREEMPKWQTVMFRRHINLLFFRTGIVVHCRFQPRGPLCGGKVSAMGTRAEASASQDTLST